MSTTRTLEAQQHLFGNTGSRDVPTDDRPQVYPELRRRLVAGDACAAALGWALPAAMSGSLVSDQLSTLTPGRALVLVAGLVIAVLFTLAVIASERLYRARVSSMRTVEVARLARASLAIGTAALIAYKFLDEEHLARVPLLTVACTFVFLNVWRASFAGWLRDARRHGRFTRPVLLIGTNDEALNMSRVINAHPELGYRFIGVVGDVRGVERSMFEIPYLGEISDLDDVLDRSGVKGAIVIGGAVGRHELNTAIRRLLAAEIHVHLSTGINGIDHRRLRNHSLAYEPLVYVERIELERWQLMIKRTIDIAVASTVLLVTAPILLASIIAIRKHDHGPAMFRQERIGHHGHPFQILKLRSMVTDAESKLAELQRENQRHGPLFKLSDDPRVTPIGRILRATSIDELPQLVNVLRGDMSLVGPRPALRHEVDEFDDDLSSARHNVQPGITGLWQVEGRDNPDFAIYQRLDLFYVENWSVMLDISILFATARVVLARAKSTLSRSRSKHGNRVIVLE